MTPTAVLAVLLTAGTAPAPEAVADTAHQIIPEETLVAVVTRRAGMAGRLAHDHLIHADRYEARLSLVPEDPPESCLELTIRAQDLVVDDGRWQREVEGRLEELGLMDGPFQDTSEGERSDIREEMLGPEQLDAKAHPEIHLRTAAIEARDDPEFPFEVEVILTLREESRLARAPARLEVSGGQVLVEAYATFRFTDFGIPPFSAYWGLVRNRDPFHLYLRLTADSPQDDPYPTNTKEKP